jgi:RNA recognition motif-containing protein
VLTQKYVEDIFSKYGSIPKIKIPTLPNGMNLGYAFITFKKEDDMDFYLTHLEGIEEVSDATISNRMPS